MGNSESTFDKDQRDSIASYELSKSLYEVLQVSETASEEEIRTSFRKLALLHHPDKCPGRELEATRAFAQIRHAYSVLTDPQERAWYDRNRGKRRNGPANTKKHTSWTADDLMPFFDPEFYDGLNDNPKGFFTAYRRVFEHIIELEKEANDHEVNWPSFGHSGTQFDPFVKAFYDTWLGFVTGRLKDYFPTDLDHVFAQDNIFDETNRRHRRHLEKERERLRDAARKEYSEQVRSLAAFVRKRDPRYKQWLADKQNRQKEKQKSLKRTDTPSSQSSGSSWIEPEWSKIEHEDEEWLRQQLAKLELDEEDSKDDNHEEAEDPDTRLENDLDTNLFCVACKKLFKTKSQWLNHARSKKHLSALTKYQEATEDLEERTSGDEEEELLDLDKDSISSYSDELSNDGPELIEEEKFSDNKLAEEKSNSNPQITLIAYEESRQKPPKRKERQRKSQQITHVTNSASGAQKLKKQKHEKQQKDPILTCNVCKITYTSRNKLFEHLNETNHARAK